MKNLLLKILLAGLFLVKSLQLVQADILDHWTTTQITTNLQFMTSIARGNGEWVATAELYDGVNYYYSSNGSDWTQADFFSAGWGSAMKFENDHFIGVGGYGIVSYSTNGIEWKTYYLPNAYIGDEAGFGDISYGNGLFVSVGKTNYNGTTPPTLKGYILSSPDGTNWASRLQQAPGYIRSITYGAGTFVAVGDNDGRVYYGNGLIWNRGLILGGNEVRYANGLFFIPMAGTNLVSTDGGAWAAEATGLRNKYIYDIKYSHGLFMGSANGTLATSTDGINWQEDSTNWIPAPFASDGFRVATITNLYVGLYPVFGYNGYINLSEPLADIQLTNGATKVVVLTGLVGRQYQIQSSDSLGATADWRTNLTTTLTNKAFVWTDTNVMTSGKKFYRAGLLP